MTYQEAYEYFDSLHNLPREYKGKGNWQNTPTIIRGVRLMLKMAGSPELKIPHYIHVTGTSGKGSVSMMISQILKAQGFKVGLVTSPHPTKITERWQINNHSMSEREFVEMVTDLKPIWDEYIHSANYTFPSMVSLNTIIALYYFAKNKVDYAVLEVTCGGKNDGTNVIPYKDIAIITNIGLDHISILGNTKEQIAENKSGIITKGCNVFTAEHNPKLVRIIEKAAKNKKALSFKEVETDRYGDKSGTITKQDWDGTDFKIDGLSYHLNNLGYHQIDNAKVVIAAAKKLGVSHEAIQKGLAATEFPIRFEVVGAKPHIILDGAHNADKVKATILGVKNLNKKYHNLHLLIGFSDNKDHSTFLKELLTLKPKSLACTRFTKNIFRKTADPKKLMNSALKIDPKLIAASFLDPQAALKWSQKQAGVEDLVLVTGSMFLSGELRPLFKKIQ
ncbi:MAG: Mur ligase family protein [Candidatus Falkowbacteria bacterium]